MLDVEARELRRAGRVVPLSPQALELLLLLLAARPRALPQTDLRDALWPETHVGYTSLARVVSEARKAIGDTAAEARLIRTVPRFGYAFAGTVRAEEPGPVATLAGALVGKDREYPIPEGETLVGRGRDCGVQLPFERVSRVHARVRIDGGVATVEDLGSKNGTWVNGVRAAGAVTVTDGDEVVFGTVRLVFRRGGPAETTRTGLSRGTS